MGHLAPASLLGRARQRGHRAAKVRSRRSSRNSCTKEFWVWLLILVFAWAVFRVWDNHEGTCTLLSKSLFSSQQSHDQELQHVCHRPRAFIQYTGLTTWFSLGEGGGRAAPLMASWSRCIPSLRSSLQAVFISRRFLAARFCPLLETLGLPGSLLS